MIDAVRLPKAELKARFACSERLAVRVGALLSRGVGVTEAVLEETARQKDLQQLLLSPELLSKAAALDTAALHALGPAAAPLTIVVRDAERVIALEEETLAEKAWSAEKPSQLPAVAASSLPAGKPAETGALRLTSDQFADIKMVLLTGVDPRAKIEAIRKLVYAPVDPGERGALALRALADPDAEVRQEAAAALERLGLDRELAEALRTVAAGSARQKGIALQKVASMAAGGTPAERSVALAMLASGLAYERDEAVLRPLLSTLESYAELIGGNAELFGSLARNLVQALADRYDALAAPARSLLIRIGKAAGGAAADVLWRENEGLADRRLKVLLFEALCSMKLRPELRRELCTRVATELASGAMDDLDARRLADGLQALGNDALRALLAALPGAREDNRPALVSLVDALASGDGVSAEARDEAGERFLALLREGSRALRATIMEARCCWHPKLDPGVKRKLASDFIANLHAYRQPRLHELTNAALRRMGLAVVEPLQQCLAKSAYPVERAMAADVLSHVAAQAEGHPKEVAAIVGALRREEEGGRIPVGHAVRCAGRAASGPGAPPELVQELYRDYWERLGKVSYAFDALAALAQIGAGRGCDPAASTQILLKMLDLLEAQMPDPTVSETKTDEGTQIVVGAQTVVYTDYIPMLIAGVKDVYLGGRLREGVRKLAVERLCSKYASVTQYKEIWAPGNIVDLAESLGRMASADATALAERVKIIETLLTNVRNVTMVRILGRTCRRPEETSRLFGALVGQFARRAFEMAGRREYQEPEDQRAIIEALGRVGVNRIIGESKKESDEMRGRIVELLMENAEAAPEARALLRDIASSEHTPKALRKRIEGALG